MRFSQGAYFRSQAYFMASDIIDRMRNNSRAVTNGLYDGRGTSANPPNPNCNAGNCTFQEMVDQDIYDWSSSIHNLTGGANFIPALPSGPAIAANGTITQIEDNQYRVTLTWAETVNGNSEAQSLTVNFATEQYDGGI